MCKEHPCFEAPAPDTTIWRYMDFTKFVSLLETKTLYFARSDRFDDRFEGSYPEYNVRNRESIYGDCLSPEALRKFSAVSKAWRRYVAINCWHIGEHESAAMWRLYLTSNEGIAIRSTCKGLEDCFAGYDRNVHIGMVKYIDYASEWMPEGNIFYPFVHKRKSFEHERELRALIWFQPSTRDGEADFSKDVIENGVSVPIDVPCLLRAVYVAPDAPAWFRSLTEAVLKRYELDIPVTQSLLAQDPVY